MLLVATCLAVILTMPVAGAVRATKTASVPGAVSLVSLPTGEQPVEPQGKCFLVVIDENENASAEVTIHVGDEAVRINKDIIPHTVTARNGLINSGEIGTGSRRRLVFSGPV
jgi:plastocyanin